mmetsp:Transcript_85738/g.165060  ORF Transcript_85738/g.165060 Transcript_85738/m.165060 type:complete len:114 (-) Transcript_85738:1056-1397(-)
MPPDVRLYVVKRQAAKGHGSTNGTHRVQQLQQPQARCTKQQASKAACITQQHKLLPPQPPQLQDRRRLLPISLVLPLKARLPPFVLQQFLQLPPAVLCLCQKRITVALIEFRR